MVDAVRTLFEGIGVGIHAFFSAVPIYNQISNVRDQLLAYIFGIPVFIITILSTIKLIIRLIKWFK